MSKAKEFAVLAKAATQGEWEALGGSGDVPPRVRAIWRDEEGRRCMRFIAVLESGNHDEDAQYIAWCGNNRERVLRALRLEELTEEMRMATCSLMIEAIHVGEEKPVTPARVEKLRRGMEALRGAVQRGE